jgi:hypothetical protein
MASANDGDVFNCDLNTFVSHYLPFEPPDKLVDAAMEALKTKKLLRHIRPATLLKRKKGKRGHKSVPAKAGITSTHTTGAGSLSNPIFYTRHILLSHTIIGSLEWVKFPTKPAQIKGNEDTVFEPLRNICDTLGTVPCEDRDRNLTLELRPRHTTASEVGGSTHRVDGFLRPNDRTINYPDIVDSPRKDTFRTAEIAVTFEFKRLEHDGMIIDVRPAICVAFLHLPALPEPTKGIEQRDPRFAQRSASHTRLRCKSAPNLPFALSDTALGDHRRRTSGSLVHWAIALRSVCNFRLHKGTHPFVHLHRVSLSDVI